MSLAKANSITCPVEVIEDAAREWVEEGVGHFCQAFSQTYRTGFVRAAFHGQNLGNRLV